MPSKLVRREQCPLCADEGRDLSANNLAIYDDEHQYCYAGHGLISLNKGFQDLEFTYEYLPWRNIDASTMRFYDVKTKISPDGVPISLGFKYPSWYKVRLLDRKEFYIEPKGAAKGGLYGRDKFSAGSHKYVTITEGEPDALSLWQVLRAPVVSAQSSSSAHRDCVVDRDWLGSFSTIYLAFDGDTAGREATRNVAKLFDPAKVRVVKFDKRKDANEYLQHGEIDDLRNVWNNAKLYLPDYIISSFDDFEKVLTEPKKLGVPYPFPELTEMTYGIRTSESILITAPEGVGKTELMHALEYQLLRETNDNIAAIFIEEPKRRHLEALAGISLQRPAHLPDSGCTDQQILSAVVETVGRDDRLHIHTHFGSSDPDVLLDTIRFLVAARGVRYVLLDHITMVVSGLAGEDERKALDYLATRLEVMVKELDFALILVSHVNDNGETRGSRMISKVADVRIDLSRDIRTGSNVVNLIITKPSRFVGKSGFVGSYTFDQVTRQYSRVPDQEEGSYATPSDGRLRVEELAYQ